MKNKKIKYKKNFFSVVPPRSMRIRGFGSCSRRNNWQFNKCSRAGQTKINQLEGLCNVGNKLSVHPPAPP
jgi:hypothetical protein